MEQARGSYRPIAPAGRDEGEAALEMAFIQQWGRGWLVQVEGQCPGGLLPAGGVENG